MANNRDNIDSDSSSESEIEIPPTSLPVSRKNELKSQSNPMLVGGGGGEVLNSLPLSLSKSKFEHTSSREIRPRPAHRTKDEHMKMFKTPKETVVSLLIASEKKASLSVDKYIFQSIMSGFCISIGGTVAIAIGYLVPWPGINRLIFASLFPIGLLANCVFGCELFTGNTMFFSLAGLQRNVHWTSCLLTTFLSWVFNWAGCVFFAWLLVDVSELFDPTLVPGVHQKILDLGVYKNSIGFGQVLLRAIPANFLVCMAVFMYNASEDFTSKILSVYFPVMSFIASGWEHSVANMFFCSLSIFSGSSADYGTFVWKNLIPSTIGNFIGGGIFVGAASYYLYAFGEQQPLIPEKDSIWFSLKNWSFFIAFQNYSKNK